MPNVVQLLNELAASARSQAPRNDFGLTPRELEIVALVTEGCGNREIAGRLTISEETVKRHLTHIFDKVGMSTRLELALFALDHSLATTRLARPIHNSLPPSKERQYFATWGMSVSGTTAQADAIGNSFAGTRTIANR